ncbi:hypothetical protein CKY47_25140 [Saccharothrix yanglingensis]|uniref:YbaB/EbfC DNA-binding family protein n=1 Tax=Saccharothrix yanglingensis TaxID=659496 RepID=A0ABU0X519_9PSEU|nr:hypothetical protein [Saccharothrix yanglingensis]
MERAARRVAEAGRRAAEHVARTGPVFGRASSPDGAVTVVAVPGGPPREVRVSPAALRMGPRALADEILRVSRRASRDAADRSLERVVEPEAVAALAEIGFERGPDEDFGFPRGVR